MDYYYSISNLNFRIFSKDILSLIIENLTYEDYCRFKCISKYINTLSKNISYYLDIKLYNIDFISKKIKPLSNSQNLPNLYFNKKMIFINDKYLDNSYFERRPYFQNSFKYIETFIFEPLQSTLYMDHYENVREYNRDMKILYNSASKDLQNCFSNKDLLKLKRPRLSDFILDNNTIINLVLSNSKNLTCLEIIDNIHIIYNKNKDRHFKRVNCILCNFPVTLKVLNLSGVVNMNDELLDLVTTYSPKLIKLNISKSQITNNGLEYLRRLNNLITFNISFTQITNQSFEIIGDLPNLRKLDISLCHLITDYGIDILVRKNPKLTHINMEYTNIGQNAINSMAIHLKAPMYINMDYTHYAEFINVSVLKQKCKVFTYKKI